jgi:predicted transcriptional regulator
MKDTLTSAEAHLKREQFRLAALASWNHYKVTGLHIMQEEFDDWVTKLEAGGDVESPECHT